MQMARWTWSVQGSRAGLANAQVSMERINDGAQLEVEVRRLVGGAGQPAVSWVPVGWRAEPGNTYRVRLDGVGAETVALKMQGARRLLAIAQNARALARPDAAASVADACEAIARRSNPS
jgi:hypothetical protein